ncbi:tetratricopeptide repeat protein [Hyalangium gracile]|uniref:tetratricopeptide repeat protein n=1 Tax=Hyalangium gracile TaxID=394092 RepID=UPI001CCB03CC|nr:hypothetical protein [Hyalangium gracile]
MSTASTQPTSPGLQEQAHATTASLPLETDPAGLTERAPAGETHRASTSRWLGPLALAGLGLAIAGMTVPTYVIREVQLVNGLARPVEVRLNDQPRLLQPGELSREDVFSLGAPYHVEARWPGSSQPFETVSLEATQRSVYNVLGAASLRVGDPTKATDPTRLEARTGSLRPEEEVRWAGNWEQRLREDMNAKRWREAADLARAVFHADSSQLQAAETAATLLARTQPDEALRFAQELARMSPDALAVHRLAQDLFLALGKREEAFALYSASAEQAPDSARRALLAAHFAPPEQRREAYDRVRKRFPEDPETMRVVAHFHLDDGYGRVALHLLDTAREKSPEPLEALELRVRVLIAERAHRQASEAVHQFAEEPGHGSWELAILAARVALVTEPKRLQGTARALIPPRLTTSPEHMALFDLLTEGGTVSKKQLKSIQDPATREAIALTQTTVQDPDKAVELVRQASEEVVWRLDPETAALLALRLSRLGEEQAATRVFGSSLSLMAAREPLERYLHHGEKRTDFLLHPPGLQAAAHLARSRPGPEPRSSAMLDVGQADSPGGIARRALDPFDKSPPAFEDVRTVSPRPSPTYPMPCNGGRLWRPHTFSE